MRNSLSRRRSLFAAFVTLGLVAGAGSTFATKGAWDHVANIRDAANRLALMHKQQGSQGVMKFLEACYRTQLLFTEYSKGLESCMAQDYMHSQVLARVYSALPQDELKRMGAPTAQSISDSMGKRLVAAFSQYKVPAKDAEDFRKLVDKHGTPVFLKAVFPPKNKDGEKSKPESN